MNIKILQSIACLKQILISVPIITVFLFISIGTRTDVFAQVQPKDDPAARLQTLNAIQDANDHYYERRYAEAIKAYQALLKIKLTQPQIDSMRLMLGQSYAKLGEDAEARRIFKEIIDDNPDGSYATQSVHQLSNLYSQRYQFKEAIVLCKHIVKQHPNSSAAAIAAYLTAYYEYVEGRHEEAMASYKSFLDNFPNSIYRSSAISSLVRLYTENERYAEAEKLITERMKLNPSDTTLLEELAKLYQQQGKYQQALELYKGVLEKNPANTSIRRKLGSLYIELGNKEQAIAEWKKLVAGETDQYQQLGTIYLSHKMYPEAIAAFQQAINANPRYGYLYTQLAATHKIQGDIEKAAATCLDGLESVGPSGSQRESIWTAMLEIYQGDRQKPLREKLIAQFQKSYQAAPRNLNIALTLGELFFYAGQLDEALKTFTQLHRNYPTYIDATLERFGNTLERNQNQFAINYYKKLLQLSTDMRVLTNTRYKLVKLFQNAEQWGEAVNILQEMNKNSAAPIDSQLLLAQIQLHGLHDPKAAQITIQPLLRRRLISNQFSAAQLVLGECHLLLKRYTLAREVLTPIADSTNRASATARKLIGDSYFFGADFNNAVTNYKKVIHISKSDKLTNNALERIALIQENTDYFSVPLTDYANALQLYLTGDIEAAITQCEDTITLYPKSLIVDDVWMLLGSIYRSQNAYGDALHSYRQIVSQEGPLAAEALTQIAEIYQKKRDFTNALNTYTTLLTTYPDSSIVPHARQQLDKITKLMKNPPPNSP
ncbi:MAG: tetratricopeptide repeat protein [Candidatus Poribacteria bacterium]|nr:tetratricopeptide repeat protein [Candidatus Poribacteria bacterium]